MLKILATLGKFHYFLLLSLENALPGKYFFVNVLLALRIAKEVFMYRKLCLVLKDSGFFVYGKLNVPQILRRLLIIRLLVR